MLRQHKLHHPETRSGLLFSRREGSQSNHSNSSLLSHRSKNGGVGGHSHGSIQSTMVNPSSLLSVNHTLESVSSSSRGNLGYKDGDGGGGVRKMTIQQLRDRNTASILKGTFKNVVAFNHQPEGTANLSRRLNIREYVAKKTMETTLNKFRPGS